MLQCLLKVLYGVLLLQGSDLECLNLLPLETELQRVHLKSGMQALIREKDSSVTSLRVICTKAPEQSILYSVDSEEMPLSQIDEFFANCKTQCPLDASRKQMAVVAVGNFLAEEVQNIIAKYFDDETAIKPLDSHAPITIYMQEGSKMIFQVDYRFPQIAVQTKEDLSQWWTYLLAHHLFEQRLERNVRACQAVWIHPREQFLKVVPGAFLIDEKKAGNLLAFVLFEVEKMKEKGFYEGEFAEIKQALKGKLQLLQSSDSSSALASYYVEQLENEGILDFSSFLENSLDVLEGITLQDAQSVTAQVFVDSNRVIQVGCPSASGKAWTVQGVEDIVKRASFAAEYARFAEGQEEASAEEELEEPMLVRQKDPTGSSQQVNTGAFYHLSLSDHDKSLIRSIITTVAEKSVMALPFKKSELEKKGKEVDSHVHPLRFLGYIIGDDHLKNCLREIRRSSFKWNGFLHGSSSLKGFVGNMRKESQHNNVRQYIPGFCESIRENEHEVMKYVNAHDWEGLVKYLIR